MSYLTTGRELRKDIAFKLSDDPGTRYAVICVAGNTSFRAPPGTTVVFDGQPIAYLAACDGKYLEVAKRIVDLLNRYGLED